MFFDNYQNLTIPFEWLLYFLKKTHYDYYMKRKITLTIQTGYAS